MIDVTGTDAQPGDFAIIFGDELPIQQLANTLSTIPYEILTSISRRVQRIYFYE
jgi:alanine racemase